ncbi:uncharacterized protein L201_006985 [Kwoniella dendrophila CBS 6074]|uniref:Zn(2)-C6 fungal-type domain-containing protein n=1 Tax=Kwoniella dendrophila CBS 6074 TaxID=1295534 RepID=A0AAX4K367_9TREE
MAEHSTTSSSQQEGQPPPAKRRKARRACDQCRNRKLRCDYPDEEQTQCFACQRSGARCESTQPAKIDKRRLRTLVDLATTDEQKQWVAEQIASRGIYVSSTDTGALRKARPSSSGDPAQLVARLSSPSTGNTPISIPTSISSHHKHHQHHQSKRPAVDHGSLNSPGKSPKLHKRHHNQPDHDQQHYQHNHHVQATSNSRFPSQEYQPEASSSNPPSANPPIKTVEAAAATYTQNRKGSDEPPNLKLSGPEPRMQGPTATINLLADLPEDSAALDRRYGLFRVTEGWVYGANPDIPMREGQISEQQIREDVIAKLISFYTNEIAPLNPVIPPHRILTAIETSPFILSSILAVSALSRDVPSSIYTSIRERLQKDLANELGKGSTLQQVQALLISGMSHELHGETNMEGGSNCWIRIGQAIRQSQDIGLHRLNSNHWVLPDMFADRARAWLAAIITDRWYGGAWGQPLAISLLDCEDPLESSDLLQTPDLSHPFQVEVYHISCLLGDIMQTIYRPRSLDRCTDGMLESLLRQVDNRINLIPKPFLLNGDNTTCQGGLLNLLIVSVEVIFFRSFVKHNRKLPPHVTFRPAATRWSNTVERARQAIKWLNLNGDHILDCWLPAKYAITYAALAQYYNHAAEKDEESLKSLKIAKDMMNRWSLGHNQLRPIAARAKIADIVNLFYKAALGMSEGNLSYINDQDQQTSVKPQSVSTSDTYEEDIPRHKLTSSSSRVATPTYSNGNPSMRNRDRYKEEEHSIQLPPNYENQQNTPDGSDPSRLDTSTLDDWLADFFRQHDMPDAKFSTSAAMYQGALG